MNNYGEKIAYYRKKCNLSQSELAEKLNLTRQAVSRWEHGNTEPDLDSIIKMCKIFRVSTDEFLLNEIVEYEDTRASSALDPVEAAADKAAAAPKEADNGLNADSLESSENGKSFGAEETDVAVSSDTDENAEDAAEKLAASVDEANGESTTDIVDNDSLSVDGNGSSGGTQKKKSKYPNVRRPYDIFKTPLWATLTGVFAVLLIATIVGGSIAYSFKRTINSFLGLEMYEKVDKEVPEGEEENTEYFTSNYSNIEEVNAETKKLSMQEQREGTTLLWNNSDAFPLGKANISLFGLGAYAYANSGTGSGSAYAGVDMKTAFENAGLKVNSDLWEKIKAQTNYYSVDSTYKQVAKKTSEIPWNIQNEAASSYSRYSDAAVYVITRKSGEVGWGNDLQTTGAGTIDGDFFSLFEREKEILKKLTELKKNGTFKKVVVLLNTAEGIGFNHLVEYKNDIDACLWIGQGGTYGLEELGRIMTGESIPSGHLPDTFVMSGLSAPSSVNHEYDTYVNKSSKDWGSDKGDYSGAGRGYFMAHYTIYAEGIYVGYKYYETRYEDTVLSRGNANGKAGVKCSTDGWNYSEEVAYPFGYGLSYTTFEYSAPTFTENKDGSYTVKLTVTNTGSKDGADAVQVYVQRPYTEHDKQYKIEQAAINLAGFKKTSVLKPGAKETVEIVVSADSFKTYDAFDKKTYIREAGKYYITVAEDSHKAINNVLAAKGKTVADGMDENGNTKFVKEVTFADNDYTTFSKSSTGASITNKFEDCDWNTYANKDATNITYLSRSDWNGTYPKKVQLTVNDKMYDDLDWNKEYEADPNDKMPVYGKDNGLMLINLRGKEYDDVLWDDLLDETTFEEQLDLMRAAYGTAAMPSIVKPGEKVMDGPLGVQRNFTATSLLAASFNEELAEKVGELMGEYCFYKKVGGIYAPGANMHRSMYGGRGFEYYSEDTFLSSRMLAKQVRGIQSLGVYVNIKHFVLNDQDSSRKGISTWINEQALREVYLEVFRACVEEENAMGVMTGFNRIGTKWCGALSALNNGVLREEWGYKGFVISDCPWQVYMGTVDGLFGGNDCILYENIDLTQYEKAKTNATIALKMREATKRILYIVVNSSTMNGFSSNTEIIYYTSWWWSRAIVGAGIGFAVLFVASAIMLALSIIKRRRYKLDCDAEGITTKEYDAYYKKEIYVKPGPVKIGKLYVPRNLFITITAIVLVIVLTGLSFLTVFTVGAIKSANHKCEHVCLVCGGCTDARCKEKNCSEKCPGNHTPKDIKDGKTFVFEAEDATLYEKSTTGEFITQKGKESGCTTNPSGDKFVYKMSSAPTGTQLIFKIYSPEKCAAGLIMTMGHNSRDVALGSIFNVRLNGKAVVSNAVFAKCDDGEPLYFTWKDTEIAVLTLKEGVNTIVFEKTSTSLNFDCIKLVSKSELKKAEDCEEKGSEHDYTSYIVNNNPTTESVGALLTYCKNCGKEHLLELPVLSEDNGYERKEITPSTTETKGKAEWTYKVGEQQFTFESEIPLLPDSRPKISYTFEAEDAVLVSKNGKATVATAPEGSNASGGKYIDNMSADENGASLTWNIDAENDCFVDLVVSSIKHYAQDRPYDTLYKITVNGTEYKTNYTIKPNTDEAAKATIWTTFYDFKLLEGVKLTKGSNTIVFTRVGMALNLDAIRLLSAEKLSWCEDNVLKIEAEDCTLGGNARATTESGMNDPSGGKFVGGLSGNVGSIAFTVTAEKGCTAKFILCYGNRTNDTTERKFSSKFTLTHNGTALSSEVVFNNGTENNYFGWEEYVICTVNLVEGDNTFVLTSTGVTASNIDYFKLTSAESLVFKKA